MYANVNLLWSFQQSNQFVQFFLRTLPFGIKFAFDTFALSNSIFTIEILVYEMGYCPKVFFILRLCEEIVCRIIRHNLNF